MSANLDKRADGIGAVILTGNSAWHNDGIVRAVAPTFSEAMAETEMNHGVETRPAFYYPPGAVFPVKVPDTFIVVRTDRESREDGSGALAAVGSKYACVSAQEAFRPFEYLIGQGVASIETAGALNGGRDEWMLLRFKLDDPLISEIMGNEIGTFGLIATNHTGARPVMLKETPIRVVCQNTLSASLATGIAVKVRHKGNASERVTDAASDAFERLTARYHHLAEAFRTMKETHLTVDAFLRSVCDPLAPLPKDGEGTERGQKVRLTRSMDTRAELLRLWDAGKGHKGDRSAWEAYNAAVECLDHDADRFRTNKGTSRLESMMLGPISKRKDAVFSAVMAECIVR